MSGLGRLFVATAHHTLYNRLKGRDYWSFGQVGACVFTNIEYDLNLIDAWHPDYSGPPSHDLGYVCLLEWAQAGPSNPGYPLADRTALVSLEYPHTV